MFIMNTEVDVPYWAMSDLLQKNSNYIEFLVHWAIQDMQKAY